MSTPGDEFRLLLRIARQAGLESRLLAECLERQLLPLAGPEWDREAYVVACRIRRLTNLGVNLAGIEVALHMRQRLVELQRELAELRAEMRALEQAYQEELARLARQLAEEIELEKQE